MKTLSSMPSAGILIRHSSERRDHCVASPQRHQATRQLTGGVRESPNQLAVLKHRECLIREGRERRKTTQDPDEKECTLRRPEDETLARGTDDDAEYEAAENVHDERAVREKRRRISLDDGCQQVATHGAESSTGGDQKDLHGDSMTRSAFYVYPLGA